MATVTCHLRPTAGSGETLWSDRHQRDDFAGTRRWDNNATGHTGYKLEYDTADTFDVDPQTLTIAAGTESTQVVTLLPSTTYFFRF